MDLTTCAARARSTVAAAMCALVTAGCGSDTPFEFGDQALRLPATLEDALPLATSQARARSEGAYLTRKGGGFAVMDAQGRAWNHSFIFHAREGRILRKITVHLIHGSPWVTDENVPDIPRPFADSTLALDSQDVIQRAVQLAPSHGLSLPSEFAARLSVSPSWPEPANPPPHNPVVAWRVDFLALQPISGSVVYFSSARIYFNPVTGDELGTVIPPNGPELYPFP